jgi:hypothetical protein
MKAEKKREFSLPMLIKLLQSVLALMRQKYRWPKCVRDGFKDTPDAVVLLATASG